MRKRMKLSKDKKVFSHTAVVGKKANLINRPARGGIRM